MTHTALWLTGLAGLCLIVVAFRRRGAHRSAVAQLARDEITVLQDDWESSPRPLLSPQRRWLAILFAGLSGTALYLFADFPIVFTITLAVIVGIGVFIVVESLHERQLLRLERQLADTVDLLVASLRAGAGILDAMEDAVRESRRPLQKILEETLARLRYGDSPHRVFSELTESISLESVRLFSLSLAVHWEVGGSLASSLSSVGHFIRDRVEVQRSVSTQGAQVRASVIGVTLVAYFIAIIVWRSRPDAMEAFLTTTVGTWLAAVALLLQALGLFWMFRLSRIPY